MKLCFLEIFPLPPTEGAVEGIEVVGMSDGVFVGVIVGDFDRTTGGPQILPKFSNVKHPSERNTTPSDTCSGGPAIVTITGAQATSVER